MTEDEKDQSVQAWSMILAGVFVVLRYALFAVAIYLYATGNINTFWAMVASAAALRVAEFLHDVATRELE